MTTATERADELFRRLMLSDERCGLPPHVAVVAADVDDPAALVWEGIDQGWPTVVVDADGGEMLVTPASGLERILDRLRRRSRVRVDTRRAGEPAFQFRGRADRAAFERELLT